MEDSFPSCLIYQVQTALDILSHWSNNHSLTLCAKMLLYCVKKYALLCFIIRTICHLQKCGTPFCRQNRILVTIAICETRTEHGDYGLKYYMLVR